MSRRSRFSTGYAGPQAWAASAARPNCPPRATSGPVRGIRNLPEPACIGSVSRLWPSLADIEPQRSGRRSDRTGAPPVAPCGGRTAYPLLKGKRFCGLKTNSIRAVRTDTLPRTAVGSVWEAAQQEKARRSGPSSSGKELARSPPARPRSCAITAKLRHAPVAQAPGGPTGRHGAAPIRGSASRAISKAGSGFIRARTRALSFPDRQVACAPG